MKKELKIYCMNDCDYWLDYSLDEAKKNYCELCGEIDDNVDEAFELSDDQLDTLCYTVPQDEKPSYCEAGRYSFREMLILFLDNEENKPGLFASTEY
jgi:hypothetical protein